MAAVTVNSRYQNVIGSRRAIYFNVTLATSGDTLNTGLESVLFAVASQTTNAPSVIAKSGGGTTPVTLTFTTGGVWTGDLEVIGT